MLNNHCLKRKLINFSLHARSKSFDLAKFSSKNLQINQVTTKPLWVQFLSSFSVIMDINKNNKIVHISTLNITCLANVRHFLKNYFFENFIQTYFLLIFGQTLQKLQKRVLRMGTLVSNSYPKSGYLKALHILSLKYTGWLVQCTTVNLC